MQSKTPALPHLTKPVLHAITVEPAEKAKEDIVYFN